MPTWCWFFNNGLRGGTDCRKGTKDCKFEHVRVADEEFKKHPAPQRSRSASPASRNDSAAPAGGKGERKGNDKGKGKGAGGGGGKGKGKDGAVPRALSNGVNKNEPKDLKKPGAFRMDDGKKVPYYCKMFLENKCPCSAKDCKFRHLTQGQLTKEIAALNP